MYIIQFECLQTKVNIVPMNSQFSTFKKIMDVSFGSDRLVFLGDLVIRLMNRSKNEVVQMSNRFLC